jgi:hypothetical protein
MQKGKNDLLYHIAPWLKGHKTKTSFAARLIQNLL